MSKCQHDFWAWGLMANGKKVIDIDNYIELQIGFFMSTRASFLEY